MTLVSMIQAADITAECECHGGGRKTKFRGQIRDYIAWRNEHRDPHAHNVQVFRETPNPVVRFWCTCGGAYQGEAAEGVALLFEFAKTHGYGARRGGIKKGHVVTGEVC